jgi:putative aminopeptidase FrvX
MLLIVAASRTFLELVAIDSLTGMEKIGPELSPRFSELGCQVSQDEVDNLIAVLPGAVADAVLVSTHMDTAGAVIGIQPIIATGLSAPRIDDSRGR